MGNRKGRSEKKKDWLGNKYIQHYNAKGEKSGTSEFKKDWLGNQYTQHHNAKGDKSGRSEQKKDWTGNSYTQKYNASGENSGTSERKKDWLGNKYTQHYDKGGTKTDTSEKKKDWLGNRYTERTSEKNRRWCFITTACAAAHGLPDDCEELTILRRFRDQYVLRLPTGKALVAEYYSISPAILRRIALDPHATEILQDVFLEIQKAVRLILRGQKGRALELYCSLVSALRARFLGDLRMRRSPNKPLHRTGARVARSGR